MSIIKKNIAANFGANIWSALLALVFTPVYVNYLGVESYALVGLFQMIIAIAVILDMGLTTTLSRELARLSVIKDAANEMRTTLRTLEVIYWVVAVVLGVCILALAPVIAFHWVNTENISPYTVQRAIFLIGATMLFRWPFSLYSGGLNGLQKQVVRGVIVACEGTFRSVGAAYIVWKVSPTIEAFFIWQVIVSLVTTSVIAIVLWSSMPKSEERARFSKATLTRIWKFAAGIGGITIAALALTQTDKIVLSKLLSLEMFGYYSIAAGISANIYRLVTPVNQAVFPRLTQLVSSGEEKGLAHLYHRSCQLISILIVPVISVLVIFAPELITLWLQDPVKAANTYPIVRLLLFGTMLNVFMQIPYAVQLAYGWTKLGLVTNIVAVCLLVPLTILLAMKYGAVGGAAAWVILNAGYVLIVIQVMHKYILKTEKWAWYFRDLILPLACGYTVCLLCRYFMPEKLETFSLVACIVFSYIITLVCVVLSTDHGRNLVFRKTSLM